MIDIQNINGYGIQDPGFALLREVAQKYCPEELQAERQTVLPDETLNLTELETAFNALLAGGSGYGELPYIGDVDAIPLHSPRTTASASASLRRRSCATCTTRRRTR